MLNHAPRRLRTAARALALLAATTAVAVFAPAAHAVDLILLSGDPAQELSGVNTYGLVYIDNQLRLVGDTTINAESVYFGPNSSIGACYDAGGGSANACTVGRNFAINATGSVTIGPSIVLRSGFDDNTPRAGGSLAISAGSISLGGNVDTRGRDDGASGNIALSATGSIETQYLTANGAIVTAAGAGGVTVAGDIDVSATSDVPLTSATQEASSGHVNVSSATSDALVLGSIYASGASGLAAIGGGNGGGVKVTGRNVRVGSVRAYGGTAVDAAAGAAGSLTLGASGWVYVLSTIDLYGRNSTNSAPSGGGAVSITAGGPVSVGGINGYGGQGPQGGGGGAGGSVTISGASAALGNIDVHGGTGTTNGVSGNGGNGGTIIVAAPGQVTLGSFTFAYGGQAPQSALAGLGGTVDVSAGDLTTGVVSTQGGGYSNNSSASPGVSGGPVKLSANGSLTLGGHISSRGSDASGTADPSHRGGNGGPMILRAAAGILTIAAGANASGGTGGSTTSVLVASGGPGGHGGSVDIVAPVLGDISSIFAEGGEGGDSGDEEGPGGNGGVIRHWGSGDLFDDTFVVANHGGSGNNDGVNGARVIESPPINLAVDGAGNLSFQSASPDAEGFHISQSIGDGPATIIATTAATTGVVATSPICQTAFLSVVAFHSGLGWTSTASAPVTWTTQPPGPQTCADAPAPTIKKIFKKTFKKTPKKAAVPRKQLKRKKWRLAVNFKAKGVGTYEVAVLGPRKVVRSTAAKGKAAKKRRKKAKAVVFSLAAGDITKAGLKKTSVVLTKKARKPGLYTLRLRTFSPDGQAKKTLTVKLEVRK